MAQETTPPDNPAGSGEAPRQLTVRDMDARGHLEDVDGASTVALVPPPEPRQSWIGYHTAPLPKWHAPREALAAAFEWWKHPGHWLLALGFVALVVLFIAQASVYWVAVIDDSYITFRFVDMFIKGHGWRFSPEGPPVEGFTNFLWAVLLLVPHWLEWDLMLASKLMGMACGVATMWAAWGLARAIRGRDDFFNLLAPALLAGNAHFSHWAMMGLETLLQTALVTAAFWRFERERRDPRLWLLSPLICTLAGMTRIDSLFYLSPLGLYGAWLVVHRRMPIKRMLLWGLIAASTFSVYYGWKIWYFGDILPNTYYAKQRFVLFEGHDRGEKQLSVFYFDQAGFGPDPRAAAAVQPNRTWARAFTDFLSGRTLNSLLWMNLWLGSMILCALWALSPLWMRRARAAWRAGPGDGVFGKLSCLIILPWLMNIYYVWHVNGDWMPNFRFFQTVLPFIGVSIAAGFGLLAQYLVVSVGSRLLAWLGGTAAFLVAGLLTTGTILEQMRIHYVYIFNGDNAMWGQRAEGWFTRENIRRDYAKGFSPPLHEVSVYLTLYTQDDSWIFMSDIGQPLWFAEHLSLYDVDGLTDPHLAHAPSRRGDLPTVEEHLAAEVQLWKSTRLLNALQQWMGRTRAKKPAPGDDALAAAVRDHDLATTHVVRLRTQIEALQGPAFQRLCTLAGVPEPGDVPREYPSMTPSKVRRFLHKYFPPTELERLEEEAKKKDFEAHLVRNGRWILEEKKPEYLLLFLNHERPDPKSRGWAYPGISGKVHEKPGFEDYVEMIYMPKIANAYNHFYRRREVAAEVPNETKIARWKRVIKRNPRMPIVYATLYAAANKMEGLTDEQRDDVMAIVMDGIERWPNESFVTDIAYEARRAGDAALARKALEISLDAAPRNIGAYWALSNIHQQDGKFAEAERTLRRALPYVDATDNGVHYHLIWLNERLGRYDEAVRLARDGVARRPTDVRPWTDLATVADRSASKFATKKDRQLHFKRVALEGWTGLLDLEQSGTAPTTNIARLNHEIAELERLIELESRPAPVATPVAPPASAEGPAPSPTPEPIIEPTLSPVPRDLSLRYSEMLFPHVRPETSYDGVPRRAPLETGYQPAALETGYEPLPIRTSAEPETNYTISEPNP